MYESFFGLSDRPFAATPQPERYFPAAAIEAARQTMYRCIDRAEGACLLVGPTGSGKTLLLEVLAEQFTERFEVAILASGRICTRRALWQAILFELGLPYRGLEEGELRLALIDHLLMDPPQSEGLLLLVDEAHTLPLRLLEELRLLGNLIRQGDPKVRLLLAGGASLEERFASPKLESFNQRIAGRCYLQSFDRGETREYVRAQVHAVGGNPDQIFSSEALDAVHRATEGIPRLVNQVCDHALILACADGMLQLDKSGIEEAWADLQQLPTPWNSAAGNLDRTSHTSDESEGPTTDTPQYSNTIEFGVLDDEPMEAPPARAASALSGNRPSNLPSTLSSDLPTTRPKVAAQSKSTAKPNQVASQTPNDEPPAVPFPRRSAHEQYDSVGRETFQRLSEVERQLASIDSDYESDSVGTEIELEFGGPSDNPFDEHFSNEEVVIDRFSASTTDALHNRPLVHCEEGRTLGAMLKPLDIETPRLMIAKSDPTAETRRSSSSPTPIQKAIPQAAPKPVAMPVVKPVVKPVARPTVNSIEIVTELTDEPSPSEISNRSQRPASKLWLPESTLTANVSSEKATAVKHRQTAESTVQVSLSQNNSERGTVERGTVEHDNDMIVVEDDAQIVRQVSVVRRQQYKQLFANLRRG